MFIREKYFIICINILIIKLMLNLWIKNLNKLNAISFQRLSSIGINKYIRKFVGDRHDIEKLVYYTKLKGKWGKILDIHPIQLSDSDEAFEGRAWAGFGPLQAFHSYLAGFIANQIDQNSKVTVSLSWTFFHFLVHESINQLLLSVSHQHSPLSGRLVVQWATNKGFLKVRTKKHYPS